MAPRVAVLALCGQAVVAALAKVTAPTDLKCGDAVGSSPAESLSVSCQVDPAQVDEVSFMLARADDPQRWPFVQLSVTVPKASDGLVVGSIPSLSATTQYLLMARSHERNSTTGWYVKWSDVAHGEGSCAVDASTAEGASKEASPIVTGQPLASSWSQRQFIEVFRHNGNNPWSAPDPDNNITLPDYLGNHNSADLGGEFGSIFSAVYKPDEMHGSFTRYCVEIANIDLPNITTVTDRVDDPEHGGYPVISNFADYVSCSGGNCFCMAYGDRRFRQPNKTLQELCPKCFPGGDVTCMCQCPESSLKASLTYTGMIPTGTTKVAGEVKIMGRWYSHPEGGMCSPGAAIGTNGCNWQLQPLSYSFSLATAFERGIFKSPGEGGQGNPELAREYFAALGAQPCGPSPGKLSPAATIVV
eukprot:TRINITY_DN25405_c0_g1_i1.p1 TRINITY_DN25405_c0_g1~~TRINITY_DN25405_c0_g1_i1.p1  ORF type:complete len:435 (-),score=54.61 TRINITY_DN25405_c0_g1_i1:190-1434(-)